MSERELRQEYMAADFCRRDPINYRLCSGELCVHVGTSCPCRHGAEFRCSDGQCVPNSAVCDGIRDCTRADDENSCPGRVVPSPEEGLPVHVILAIVSVCIVVCLVTTCILGYFILRRRKNNTSRESQSSTEPLKTRYLSPVEDTSDKYDDSPRSRKRDYIYHQMYDTSEDLEYLRDQRELRAGNQDQEAGNRKNMENKEQRTKTQNKMIVPSLCLLKNMKVYDFDNETYDSFGGEEMGKYIFKPRLKSAHARKSKQEVVTNENHEIVHSYKHAASDQLSLPATFAMDLDPENFGSMFATDLLCASTPRQPQRRLVLVGSQQSLLDEDRPAPTRGDSPPGDSAAISTVSDCAGSHRLPNTIPVIRCEF